jgi:hypothetical protein
VVAYFAIHALHQEVHPDWLCQIYPALAIAAAVAVDLVQWRAGWQRVVAFMHRWSVPGAVLMFALLFIQIETGLLSGFRRDESSRQVGVGFREVAAEVERIRVSTGASCVLVSDYGTTSWLAFYLPRASCVAQRGDPLRWVDMPKPDPALLEGKLLLVDSGFHEPFARDGFASFSTVATVDRKRGGTVVHRYRIDLLEGPPAEVLYQYRRRG